MSPCLILAFFFLKKKDLFTPRDPAQQTPLALKYGRGKSARVLGVSLANLMTNHKVDFFE